MTYSDRFVDAQACWMGDRDACRRLYSIYRKHYFGRFKAICRDYGWKKTSMLKALRIGRP